MTGSGFPPRTTFRLRSRPSRFEGCCGIPQDRGYEFIFRDDGRNLYAFVYAADRPSAQEAVAILNTLRVRVS
jgi:hypothetical protein